VSLICGNPEDIFVVFEDAESLFWTIADDMKNFISSCSKCAAQFIELICDVVEVRDSICGKLAFAVTKEGG